MEILVQRTLFALSFLTFPLALAATPPPAALPGWELVWHDEFDGDSLAPAKWAYALGVVRNSGSSQAYTKEAVEVRDGLLKIHSRAEKTANSLHDPDKDKGGWNRHMPSRPYNSGSITTKGKYNFHYGRLEVRARLPRAKGCWPAIWLLGDNGKGWPANGEIDIMEHLTQHPGLCYSTIHWGKDGSHTATSKGFTRLLAFIYERFHVYAMEWDERTLRILVNDVELAKWDLNIANYPDGFNPFRTPHYLILNTAIGGPGTWPEHPDASEYPACFEIDYVRYYKRPAGYKAEAQDEKPATQLTY